MLSSAAESTSDDNIYILKGASIVKHLWAVLSYTLATVASVCFAGGIAVLTGGRE